MKHIVIMTRVKNSNLKKLALLSVMGIMCNNVEASEEEEQPDVSLAEGFFNPDNWKSPLNIVSKGIRGFTAGKFPRFIFYFCYFTHGKSKALWKGIEWRNNYYAFYEIGWFPEFLQFGKNHKMALVDFSINLPMLAYNFLAFGFHYGKVLGSVSNNNAKKYTGRGTFGFKAVWKQFHKVRAILLDCHLFSYSYRSIVKIKLFSLAGLWSALKSNNNNGPCLKKGNFWKKVNEHIWDAFAADLLSSGVSHDDSVQKDVGANISWGIDSANSILMLFSPRIHLNLFALWNVWNDDFDEE